MSHLTTIKLVLFGLFVSLAIVTSCGDPNSQSVLDMNTGKHVGNWTVEHGSKHASHDGLCNSCHGTRLQGGISDIGCFTNAACHSTVTSCGTCHGNPPTGRYFPNTAGAHGVHWGLQNTNFDCNTCHSGAGDGTVSHMNYTVEADFTNTTYNAQGGSVAYSAATTTCSEISCHGGQNTPNWEKGKINVNSQCYACHQSGTTQYNSYNSGEHNKHVNGEEIGCTECHDTAKLTSVHFDDLDSTGMSESHLTIIDAANYSGGNCTINCHGESHSSESW